MMEAENLKDMELESMIEKLQEVLVESDCCPRIRRRWLTLST